MTSVAAAATFQIIAGGGYAPPGGWVNYGAVGLIVVAFLTGAIVTRAAYQREITRADRLEVENAKLHQQISERTVPLLTRAVLALEYRTGNQPPGRPDAVGDDYRAEL